MQALGLPKYEYTIRDTKSGALFLGLAHQLTISSTHGIIDLLTLRL